ncbi:MAG: hypothetical protein J6I53_00235 [Treponema sp.]|nr:hypothetical protein [Treponema sp.]
MKSRFLHFILAFLLLFSAPFGAGVQTAFLDSSDDIKVVTIHSSSRELTPLLLTESKIIERTLVRSQKKSASTQEFNHESFCASADFSFSFPSFTSSTIPSSRILLLPKSLKTVIFLQTLI